jgi:LysM repeat protein
MVGIFSQNSWSQTGHAGQYLTFRDTVETIRIGDRTYLQHIMAQGQTLFGLSRFYGLQLEELYHYNPEMRERTPAILDTVLIPIPRKAILPYTYPEYARWKGAPLFYTVQRGETLYQIARRYFSVPVDSLKAYNRLYADNIQPGDRLFIGWMSTKGIPDSIRSFTGHPLWGQSHSLRTHYMRERKTQIEKEQQGYGNRILTENSGSDLVVLHNEAKVNTVVALKNPLNNRIVFARVIGPIPPGTYPVGTVVVTSDLVARMLAVKDERFFIRVKYLE